MFKLFWYKVFVQWKLKLLNFLMDSVLILIFRLAFASFFKENSQPPRLRTFYKQVPWLSVLLVTWWQLPSDQFHVLQFRFFIVRYYLCLVPRRLSFDVRAKEGGKETTAETRFARRLYPSHGPLRFITSHSRFALASAMRKKKRLRSRLVLSHRGHPTSIFGKYLFGRQFEI